MAGLFWTLSKWAFVILMMLLAVLLIAAVFIPSIEAGYTRPESGCYWTDRLVYFVECVGFPGSKSVGFLLSLPLLVFVYAPALLIHSLVTGVIVDSFVKSPQGVAQQVGLTVCLIIGLLWPIRWAVQRFRKVRRS